MRCHRKGQTHIHTARITFNWGIEKFFGLSKGDNLIKLPFDFSSGHSDHRTIQEYIFASCQFWLETCAHLQQARDASLDAHPPLPRFGNPAYIVPESGLSSSVTTN